MAATSPLPKLNVLDFPVLDEQAAVNLAKLRNLTWLCVHLSDDGDDQRLKKLRQALPNCKIVVGSGGGLWTRMGTLSRGALTPSSVGPS